MATLSQPSVSTTAILSLECILFSETGRLVADLYEDAQIQQWTKSESGESSQVMYSFVAAEGNSRIYGGFWLYLFFS